MPLNVDDYFSLDVTLGREVRRALRFVKSARERWDLLTAAGEAPVIGGVVRAAALPLPGGNTSIIPSEYAYVDDGEWVNIDFEGEGL